MISLVFFLQHAAQRLHKELKNYYACIKGKDMKGKFRILKPVECLTITFLKKAELSCQFFIVRLSHQNSVLMILQQC